MVANVRAELSPEICSNRSLDFFTTVADRLLKRETGVWLSANPTSFQETFGVNTNFGLTGIPVFVNNKFVYSSAVHRLLQVTANIYDATHDRTNLTDYPYLPSVFQPIFGMDANTNIFITGFIEVTNTTFLLAPHRIWDLNSSDVLQHLPSLFQPDDSIYNVPLVIGAKKGFPNFNEFSSQTSVTVVRKLQFHRTGSPYPFGIDQTNQIYVLSVSNLYGVALWNSYSNAFPRDLYLEVGASVTVALTNQYGTLITSNMVFGGAIQNISSNTWDGFSFASPSSSFVIPVMTNTLISTGNRPSPWLTNEYFSQTQGFPIDQWMLNSAIRMRYVLTDASTGRIIDYAAFSVVRGPEDVTSKLMFGGTGRFPSGNSGDLWWTNHILGGATSPSILTPTVGIYNQIVAGLGSTIQNGIDPKTLKWQDWSLDPIYGGDVTKSSRRFFYYFFGVNSAGDTTRYTPVTNFSSPFNPTRTVYQVILLAVNDPLVHYTLNDLIDLRIITNTFTADTAFYSPTNSIGGLGKISVRYSPWGGNILTSGSFNSLPDPDIFNLAVKDPFISSSDSWNFPTNRFRHADWLGSVHRGTPWQTLYLKSADVNPLAWETWTGDANSYTAQFTRPTNDWRLVRQLIPLLEKREPRRLFSVNNPDTNAWLRILGGMVVITNSLPEPQTLIMSRHSPQAAVIADAIERTRLAQAGHYFLHASDILETPELSAASPWLDLSLTNQYGGSGLTDQALELIPSQLLPLLREDSIGSITVCSNGVMLQFTGCDDCAYAVECSRNLSDWRRIGYCCPTNGSFNFAPPADHDSRPRYYRTVILPGPADDFDRTHRW
jgi:hypothetical protein